MIGQEFADIFTALCGLWLMCTTDVEKVTRVFPRQLSWRCNGVCLAVNYRGSAGYGEDSINSLPGNIGRNDVDDVHVSSCASIRKRARLFCHLQRFFSRDAAGHHGYVHMWEKLREADGKHLPSCPFGWENYTPWGNLSVAETTRCFFYHLCHLHRNWFMYCFYRTQCCMPWSWTRTCGWTRVGSWWTEGRMVAFWRCIWLDSFRLGFASCSCFAPVPPPPAALCHDQRFFGKERSA